MMRGYSASLRASRIVECPVTFEVDDLAFFLPCFETYGADVFAAQFHIAEGAEKAAALVAGNDGLFLRMVEAACLIIDKRLSGLAGLKIAKKGGEHIDLYGCLTGWTGDKVRNIIISGRQRFMTMCAGDIFHKSGFPYNSCITDTVMECSFFIIKSHHNISDTEDHGAQIVGKKPSKGTAIADLCAI